MVRQRDRIIAMSIAIAFFVTSFGLSFMVIWQLYKDHKEAKTVNQNSSTLNDQPTQKLQGTKLAGFTPMATVDKLQKIDLQDGTGKEAKAGDTIVVHYTGALAADGTIFQSSYDNGQAVPLTLKEGPGGVITGWALGIPGMKEGGKRRLIIPADQAYGSQSQQGIPANSALVFDVTLVSIQ